MAPILPQSVPGEALVVRGGRVFSLDGDVHAPPLRDLIVAGGRIVAVTAPGDPAVAAAVADGARVLEAADRLVIPGFVNAHYHSYDVLAKGLLEDLPFDLWALLSQPAYWGPRSAAELRLRTLVGGLECLKNGVTCVQDMNSLVPQDEATLDTILSAYAELGIRVVFSCAVRDVAALDIAPFAPADAPEAVRAILAGKAGDAEADLAFVAAQIARLRPLPATLHWAVSPSGPQRCGTRLLEGLSEIAAAHALPVTTHVYETRAQLANARARFPQHGGSLVRRLKDTGLLGSRTAIAHSVWIDRGEIDMLAAAGAAVVHNPMANLKLKSGLAPLLDLRAAGVPVALGCDNCSCGDTQNMFQAVKLFALLAGGMDGLPTGVDAAAALRAGTLDGARAVGLAGEIGALAPGMRADFALIDLSDIAWQPFNSAARQLAYAECGRGVRDVVVEGRVVLRDGRAAGVDEIALRAELSELMVAWRRDYDALRVRQEPAFPWLLAANRVLASAEHGIDRFIPRAPGDARRPVEETAR